MATSRKHWSVVFAGSLRGFWRCKDTPFPLPAKVEVLRFLENDQSCKEKPLEFKKNLSNGTFCRFLFRKPDFHDMASCHSTSRVQAFQHETGKRGTSGITSDSNDIQGLDQEGGDGNQCQGDHGGKEEIDGNGKCNGEEEKDPVQRGRLLFHDLSLREIMSGLRYCKIMRPRKSPRPQVYRVQSTFYGI